jgi:hypothetical protein
MYDNHFSELKETELMNERLNLASVADPYVGIYYSRDFVRRKILHQTDQEIIEEDKIIKKEKAFELGYNNFAPNKLKDSYTSVPDILRSVVNTAITEDIPERIYSKVYAIIGQEDIANQGKVRIVYLGEIS